MNRLFFLMLRLNEIIGAVVGVGSLIVAILAALRGDRGDALLAGAGALGAVGLLICLRYMHKRFRKRADFFPPGAL